MGFWRDMLIMDSGGDGNGVDVSSGYYVLPDDHASSGLGYDSIISAMLDDTARNIRSIWHDYRRFGRPGTGSAATNTTRGGGFVDDGYTSDDTPPRRRYRVGGVNATSKAFVLLKRKYVDVDDDGDYICLPNDNSILKHALLGKLAEDNADVQRAEYHWATVQKLLEADMDSYRGSAKPVLQVSPHGAGGSVNGMY
jgi:hypothetical protein